jgi:cytochrome c551/c552
MLCRLAYYTSDHSAFGPWLEPKSFGVMMSASDSGCPPHHLAYLMKKLLAALILTPLVFALLFALTLAIAVQQGVASRADLLTLYGMGKQDGIAAVYYTVKSHLYGVDLSDVPDVSYGREQVAGRGHAPWVVRGNLDGRPRVLKFALAPQLWAAYDIEKQSLYQVWQGEVLFAGAAYNYRHGPQPTSEGEWYFRDEAGARWFLETQGKELPANVRYLGHEYGQGRTTAAMRFRLDDGEHQVELTEWPDVAERDGTKIFTRRFQVEQASPDITVGFYTDTGERFIAEGAVEMLLAKTTPIPANPGPGGGLEVGADEISQGESIIANSDCLSCHGEEHRIAGPAWSQIAGKFRGKIQDEVVSALAAKVLAGGAGVWGTIPMPPHPDMTEAQATAAVAYILSVPELTKDFDPPLDADGNPYRITQTFDILPRLTELHPSFTLENLAPDGFEPKVGGLSFREDGKLLVSTWDTDGSVFVVDPNAPQETRVRRIAEGLQEPLGLKVVDGRTFVLQKQELTELIDKDEDGIIDTYRAVSYDWAANSNFHSFAFGLAHRDDAFYFLLSICVLPGGASCPEQLPAQGKLMKVTLDGDTQIYAAGFRTPNGIVLGPDGHLYVADNQGDWLPASKLVQVREGDFYGSRAVPEPGIMARVEVPPAVWLPQDEVGNSPTEPLFMTEGPYAGQMIHGDVYNGGIKRVFLETIGERPQGAVFHFTAGLQGPVNRLQRGPDGAIYIGEVGNPPNWGEYGKTWHGLQRMRWQGNKAFEILKVRAQSNGFELELTQPLAKGMQLSSDDLVVKQWFYQPNEQYGGPKFDESELTSSAIEVSADRRSIKATIPGLKAGYVIYLQLSDRLRSDQDQSLWTAEAWYTLNSIPESVTSIKTEAEAMVSALKTTSADGWHDLFDGQTLDGWRNYGGDENAVQKWIVEDKALTLQQEGAFPMWDMISSAIFGGSSGDLIYYREKFRNFELSLDWKISENGNSGIFYLVKDENDKMPWLTGIEMQVLHNEGHADGDIITHRAGDLYDLIAAEPETVLPPGQWNNVRIRIKDNLIEHWLNGVKVVSVVRGGKQWNELVAASKFNDMPGFGKSDEGYLVLQDHGNPVWYRNIRIRDL